MHNMKQWSGGFLESSYASTETYFSQWISSVYFVFVCKFETNMYVQNVCIHLRTTGCFTLSLAAI